MTRFISSQQQHFRQAAAQPLSSLGRTAEALSSFAAATSASDDSSAPTIGSALLHLLLGLLRQALLPASARLLELGDGGDPRGGFVHALTLHLIRAIASVVGAPQAPPPLSAASLSPVKAAAAAAAVGVAAAAGVPAPAFYLDQSHVALLSEISSTAMAVTATDFVATSYAVV
jgi:hypothetical protein